MWESISNDPGAIATLFAASLTALVAIGSLRFAYVQILTTRQKHDEDRIWKKSEFVRTLLSDTFKDPQINLIARVLDWREGPARIPEYFQPLYDEMRQSEPSPPWDYPRAGKGFFEIDWQRFVDALQVERPERGPDAKWRNADQIMYRSCFDSFCAFIQNVAEDIRGFGVRPSEYADLSFYCHRVIFPLNTDRKPDENAQRILREYIICYYNIRTYNVILTQAQVYALQPDGEEMPSENFVCPDYPTAKSLGLKF